MATPKILLYVLRRDLRVWDNPILHEAARASKSNSSDPMFTHLLPLYIFASNQIEIGGFLDKSQASKSPYPEARSKVGKYWRCGPHRAKFTAESVWDLKNSLKGAGSDLCVRVGRIPAVVKEVLDFYAASQPGVPAKNEADGKAAQPRGEVVGVWMTKEDAPEELEDQEAVQRIAQEHGTSFKLFADEKYFVDE